jgi:hypothetical protein
MDANDDIPPALHIWWQANTLYPDLAASERLRLAEEALRQILDGELVVLIRNRAYPTNMGESGPARRIRLSAETVGHMVCT